MCIGRNDPGGPRRCAADTRRRLESAVTRTDKAQEAMDEASSNLAHALSAGTSHNLSSSQVEHCNLPDLNLTNSRWQGAVVKRTDLTNTDLTNADFTGAVIHRCNFTGADVTGCTFSHASVDTSLHGARCRGRVPMGLDLNEWRVADGILLSSRVE